MKLLTYQGIFSRPESVARARDALPAIKRIGGRVKIGAPTRDGLIVITLDLPPGYHPRDFFADLPFTSV